jgi:hypothetical protein
VGLERGPLSLLSTTEELLERKGIDSGLENRDKCLRKDRKEKKKHVGIEIISCGAKRYGRGKFVDVSGDNPASIFRVEE